MKRVRVTATMRKQAANMRNTRGQRLGGVLIVPRPVSIEEWEAQAGLQQDALLAGMAADAAASPPPAQRRESIAAVPAPAGPSAAERAAEHQQANEAHARREKFSAIEGVQEMVRRRLSVTR